MNTTAERMTAWTRLKDPERTALREIVESVGSIQTGGSKRRSGAVAGQYGAGTKTLVVTVNEFGEITSIEAITITGAPPTGAVGGVLAGMLPNPSFAVDMATQAELDAQVSALTALIAAAKQPYQASLSSATSFTILASTHLRGTGVRMVAVTDSSGNAIVLNVNCATNGDVTITSDGPAVAIKVAIY